MRRGCKGGFWADGWLPCSGKRVLAGELFLLGRRLLAVWSFLFVPEKEAKRARRSDAAAAGWGCGPRPRDAAT